MAAHATYSYDVLVIGAGGAGLRAAIEAANSGVSVGLICKSLLGKAHTVRKVHLVFFSDADRDVFVRHQCFP